MQNRRDHVHAHRFAVNRLSAALISGSAGTGEPPLRRSSVGTVFGIVAGVLLCAGAVVYGLLAPAPSTAWRQSGVVVVEKETGTRFVNLSGVLHPVSNYASAVLLAGGTPAPQYVAGRTLASVPHGWPVGIPGAPDTLPAASALLAGKWAVCLQPGAAGGSDGITLILGSAGQGQSLGERRLLVTAPGGGRFVIFGNVRYPLTSRSAQVALGFGDTTPLPVPAVWLDALPAGPPLAPPAVTDPGSPGPAIAGSPTQVGELFESAAGGVDQRYILLTDGLAPVSRTVYALLSAASSQAAPVPLSAAQVAAVPASADQSMLGMLPDLLAGTVYQPHGTGLCVRQSSPGSVGGDTLADLGVPVPGARAAGGSPPPVDIPSGAGMLVQDPAAASGAGQAPEYLITDLGEKYPLAGNAVTDFGYQGAAVQPVPAAILALVPTGPVLSPDLAARAVPWGPS